MSIDLDGYELLGDLERPFELNAKDQRRQQDQRRLRDFMRCDVASLTFEQYSSGVPCLGCGRPYVDAEPFDFEGTLNLSDVDRLRYDTEESHFKAAHTPCQSHRHSISGSLTMHCGKCCPPPPMSPAQRERIASLISTPTAAHELAIWRLRLYCGHTAERTAHRSRRTVHSAFGGAVRCVECGCDPATVVDARAIGLAAQPPHPESAPVRRKPTRAALERRIDELEAEVSRLRSD
jgi:hypothetical protein